MSDTKGSETNYHALDSIESMLMHYHKHAFPLCEKDDDLARVAADIINSSLLLQQVDKRLRSEKLGHTNMRIDAVKTNKPETLADRYTTLAYWRELVEYQQFPGLVFVRSVHADEYWDNLMLVELDPKTNGLYRFTRITMVPPRIGSPPKSLAKIAIHRSWLFEDTTQLEPTKFAIQLLPKFLAPIHQIE
jgi:hypothetical protein